MATLIGSASYLIKRLLDRRTPLVNNINIGTTLAEHEQQRKVRETEIRAELGPAHADDHAQLEIELRDIQQQLQKKRCAIAMH